ncbi:MAG: hypothetical protein UY07_C0009G0009 [Parcubacteria group bacterium GW2011_GWA1_47_8]|nr:MAG: hypothetical protein UY07_C0009G0009 [Parcubacteria group bacterium GW2011_GWA1_47_8]KKW07922.1 MAG: hypothetical protein UY42_C0003G0014 [Parcubacteria group bacterium GW2011_GWA2_49_16]
MKALHIIAFVLLIVGGINWGLEAFEYNLVTMIAGVDSMVTKVVYVLVGLAAIYEVATHKNTCKMCGDVSVKAA